MDFDITVVIPYHNEEQTLHQTLDLISQQTLSPQEVIFVNSSSTDGSSAIIDSWIEQNQGNNGTHYKNIFEHTDTPSSSKNVGIQLSQTEWVAFMDCGLLFTTEWLSSQVCYLKKNRLDIVSGVCDLNGVNVVDNCCLAQTYGYRRKRPVVPSTVVRKSVFNKTGLFVENRRAGYDHVWRIYLKKAKIERGINLDMVVRYNGISFADSYSTLFKKMIKYSKPTVALRHYYIPYLYIAIVILMLVTLLTYPIITIGFVLVYILARWFVIPVKKSRGIRVFEEHPLAILHMLPIGIVMDLGRIVGIVEGIHFYHFSSR